jgi:hypothetical protein
MNLSHLLFFECKNGWYSRTDIPHEHLDLAFRSLPMGEGVVTCRDLDPVHADDLGVNHEP